MRRILCGVMLVLGGVAMAAGQQGGATFVPPAEVKWVADPAGSGLKTAVMWGDPTKGAYGGFVKIPAGMQLPLHHHTHENKAVVLSGTMVITLEGGTAKEVGSGSYLLVPGGMKHTTACKAGADCVLFGQQPGPDDTIPAQPAAKK